MLNISKKQLYYLLAFFLILAFLSYCNRYPTGDDAWFAEQSYWLEKEGVIRSEFFRGLLQWEKQILVSHKLFLLFGSGMIHLFGYQLPVLQFTGFICFCVLVGQLIYYVAKREQQLNSWYLPALLVLVFANRLLMKMSFENRPEMMLAALGFGSFLLLQLEKKTVFRIVIAAFLAGLAFLSHLNGVIYLIAGFVVLIYNREYKYAGTFALAGGLTSLVYFLDVFQRDNGLLFWYHQFRNDPATQNSFGFLPKFIQLITYPRLFFQSPEQIALSLLLVFLLWHQRKSLRQLPVYLRVYSVTLFLSFWLITKANGGLYLVLFIPFMLALVYELYKIIPFKNLSLKLVIATYLIIGAYGMCQIIYTNFTMEYLPVSYHKLKSVIGNKQKGFVPLTFFFNEYEAYPKLLTHENYKLQSKKKNMSTIKMAHWAYKNGVDFILMDYKFRPEPYYPKAGTRNIPFYKLFSFDGRFAIYKR